MKKSINILLLIVIIHFVSAKHLRIARKSDVDVDENDSEKPVVEELHSESSRKVLNSPERENGRHCSEDVTNMFTCSTGPLDELLSEVTKQANILRIENISLADIPDVSFQTFNNLIELKIIRSNVSSFTVKSFQGLAQLDTLDLSQNLITNLNRPFFKSVPELVILKISSNIITSIGVTGLKGLDKLQELDLSKNAIENIPTGTFIYTPEIVSVDFSNNKLTVLGKELFNSLQKLEIIDLSHNNISEIQIRTFNNLPLLKRLSLQNNKISFLRDDVFGAPVPFLVHFAIDSNEIVRLDLEPLLKMIPGVKMFVVAPNPWECSCLNYMLELIEDKEIEHMPREYFEGTKPICKVSESSISNTINPCLEPVTTTEKTTTTSSTTTQRSTTNYYSTRTTTSATTPRTPTTSGSIIGNVLDILHQSSQSSSTQRYPIPFW